jgi:hypothetical protein
MTDQPLSEFPLWDSMKDSLKRMLSGSNHQHDWDIVDTWEPTVQRPVHPRMQGAIPATFVLVICKGCHLPQTVELEGKWTAEQLRSQTSEKQAGDDQ